MAGQQFQYDDSGNTFFYFLTSFVGLIVIPATYYFWPRDQNAATIEKVALLLGWALFLFLAYKVSKIDREYQEYNPYEVLSLDPGASISEIKRQYRLLSLKFHPDKGGDEVMFMRIAKAYAALTNEESRNNWQKYGNPDGPQATSFGIALPAWIVDQKNSMLGTWWYRSIRYSGDQILINTTQLFMHFMYKTPNMNMKRLGMVLTAAFEFDPRNNKEATIRPTDNTEVPQLIRDLGNINVKKKEPPFCYPYSLKARVLMLSHLARMEVSENTEEDQRFVVRKIPALLQEMINVGCQLTVMANSRGGLHVPRLVSIENCMKLSQMIVQGLQESKSPLLQLPHFEEEHLRYCVSKKYKVRSILDLVSLKDSDRRSMLRFLGEEKYDEVMAVLGSFPNITVDIKLQVLDDEDSHNITAGSIVTVTVTLTRKRMLQGDVGKNKSKVWQNKNKAAKKTSKSKKKKLSKKKAPSQPQKQDKQKQANGTVAGNEGAPLTKEEEDEVSDKGSDSEEGETNKDSPSERDDESDKQSDTEPDEMGGDDEEEWKVLQQSIQRREKALLETKSKITHPVYSLYFPEEKQEWWWLYIADRKEQTLVSMPYHVCTLKDTEEVELRFPAPSKPGNYQYSVILKSDSFMGLDQIKPLKLEVHEAKQMLDNHPQWDIPETEEEEEDQEDSDGIEENLGQYFKWSCNRTPIPVSIGLTIVTGQVGLKDSICLPEDKNSLCYAVPIPVCEIGMRLRGRVPQGSALPWISNVLGVQSVRLRLRLDRHNNKGEGCWQLVDLGGGNERSCRKLRDRIQPASSRSPMSIPAASVQKPDNSEMQSPAMSPAFIPGQRGKIPGRKRGRPPLRSTVSKMDFQNRYSESLSPLKVPKKRGRKPGFKLKSRIVMTPLAISPPSSTPEPDMSSIPQDAATVPHSVTPQVLTAETSMPEDYLVDPIDPKRYSVDPTDSAFNLMSSPYPPKPSYGYRSCQQFPGGPAPIGLCRQASSPSTFQEGNRSGNNNTVDTCVMHTYKHLLGSGSEYAYSPSPETQDTAPPPSKDPSTWTVEDVVWFVKDADPHALGPHVEIFRKHEIDGNALLLLKSDMIMKYLGLKLGPALKLCYHIDKLKQAKF
ncbi:Translocation protein SEC63-like [Acipenser ruthenus]|uniref:Translocation protein SEC63 homolog n=1 Tax=Acipenser ruthenus TaxID=7906 RepID=A0A662YW31_ACIRT|nr:Translocation protein SEC63-like [Acipenser ruthenus]